MTDLLETVAAAIADQQLLAPGERVLVGLSGGPDSVVLLHLLKRLGYAVGAAHLDHGLRPESAAEAQQVLAWCEAWGVPCVAKRISLRRFASIEEAAREARYVFLNAVAREGDYDAIALGHHLDDQAETVLFRLARGTGPAGLVGMRPRRMQASGLPLVRPLLGVTRRAIEAALADWHLPALTDASNADPAFARNRIRHVVMPALTAINPEAARHIAATSEILAEEEALREEESRALANHMVRTPCPGIGEVDRRALLALPAATRRRLLRWAVAHWGGRWDQAALGAALAVAEHGGRADVAGGWHVAAEDGTLVVTRFAPPPAPAALTGLGAQPTAPWGWTVTLQDQATVAPASPVLVRFDPDAFSALALEWRSARPDADRFRPWGHDTAHSLRHFLTRAGVPAHRMTCLLVLASGEEVHWVVGVRRGGHGPLERTPEKVWEMQATARFPV